MLVHVLQECLVAGWCSYGYVLLLACVVVVDRDICFANNVYLVCENLGLLHMRWRAVS